VRWLPWVGVRRRFNLHSALGLRRPRRTYRGVYGAMNDVFSLKVNGKVRRVDVDPAMPLLWLLRDELALTGTKYGCGMGLCGACTVHVDGTPVRSCMLPVEKAAGKIVTTIEAISQTVEGRAVQQAWAELNVVQCGYCQSGQIMSATALLQVRPQPSDADIDAAMSGNICRCATYGRIKTAIHQAASALS
jgi:isoquinoline 1-oxidoreductase subunit alpha